MFGVTAICLFDARTHAVYQTGSATAGLEGLTRAACLSGKDADDPDAALTIRCIKGAGGITAAISFKGLKDVEQTVEPMIALVTAVYERTRVRRQLADEIKNGLTAILAAAGGLSDAGPLSAAQLEMTRMVETEASRLGAMMSQVDRIARLEQGEIQPRVEAANLTALVTRAVERCSHHLPERQIIFTRQSEAFQVLADSELILVALGQILDYVWKHSARDSSVLVQIAPRGAFVVVGISGTTEHFLPADREGVFERPRRSDRARNVSLELHGALYQAREIALAHGGELEQIEPGSVAFLLSLPRAMMGAD